MSITNHLNKIKNATYGKDVRGAIHDAIKECYDDATIDHDNANMEVKLARGVHETLNDRLDETEQNLAETNNLLDETKQNLADTATQLSAVEDELSDVNERVLENTRKTNGFTTVLEFGAKGDGESDDTKAFQNAIDYCLETLGGTNEINVIKMPPGKYKITSTITTYPQIKLVADGFVQIESYIADGSVFYLRYPKNKMFLGCDYRGKPINGNGNGILIKNMLYTGTNNNGDTESEGVFGGNNVALELGTRQSDDPTFSDARMVSRYNLEDILIYGFKTGMQINAISHFMGHYSTIRIKLCDTCVQIGEYLGQEMGTSHENFNFDSCLFERSNNVIKWIRNGVGLVFNNSSFDYIRDNLMVSKVSGQRRIIFNNGHIEKIKNYLYFGDFEVDYHAINRLCSI